MELHLFNHIYLELYLSISSWAPGTLSGKPPRRRRPPDDYNSCHVDGEDHDNDRVNKLYMKITLDL